MSGIQPMPKEEGTAWRFQISSMLAVLRARPNQDADAAELIAHLEKAHTVAVRIEDTHPPLAPPKRKGVRLAKAVEVRPLANRA